MPTLTRVPENPILKPAPGNEWEANGAFNGCVVEKDGIYHMVYRALSSQKNHNGVNMQVSSIGYAKSSDGIHFDNRQLLISPTEEWEKYGCEDPRITFFNGKFYIFYTALSTHPFTPFGIKIALAVTSDFKNIEKHPVTTFNSKAMGLFPDKVNGKMAALLTINTDLPPAKIGLALFDREEDIWSKDYWEGWYENANYYIIHLMRDIRDQVELGAPPIKTDRGWLMIHSYIKNYVSNNKGFHIEAVLLDLNDPLKIIGRTQLPLLTPEENYEMKGNVDKVIFPSGAVVRDGKLLVYYGAADTSTAVATRDLNALLAELQPIESKNRLNAGGDTKKFTRFEGNPIIKPALELEWQAKAVFNPAAIYEDGRVHLIYRAQSPDGTSVFGYANSRDGFRIDENLDHPIYTPRESFEKKHSGGSGNSGCEDPRIAKIGDRLYMTYTAFDGANPPRVALTSIAISDFLKKSWNWDKPKLISPPGVDDKDACIVKNVRKEGYIAFHRLGSVIWLDFLRDLDFPEKKYLTGGIIAQARKDSWDNVKIGIGPPPIETERGWLLLYHSVSNPGFRYNMGAMLLNFDDPRKILSRSSEPLLEPGEKYELEGQVPNVVFACGAVVIDGTVFMYYGGADSVIGVATIPLKNLMDTLGN
jgi:predicted GH43/DUF377 family glycosyl hydrolase